YPAFGGLPDPANDDYQYFLQADGNILDRYLKYNGTQGNSPVEVTNTNRGSTVQPDVEDINRDNTMNTIDSYFEYNIPFRRLGDSLDTVNNEYVTDVKTQQITTPDNNEITVRWVQFKIPLSKPDRAVNGISDFRSIRFMRMFLSEFSQNTVLRFGTMELGRGDYRRFQQTLDDITFEETDNSDLRSISLMRTLSPESQQNTVLRSGTMELVRGDYRRFQQTLDEITFEDPANDDTRFEVEAVSIEENETRQPIPYVIPPGI